MDNDIWILILGIICIIFVTAGYNAWKYPIWREKENQDIEKK